MFVVVFYDILFVFARCDSKRCTKDNLFAQNESKLDLMMRCPLLENTSIVRKRLKMALVIRVKVATSGNVLEQFALHALLLVVASVKTFPLWS